LRAPDTPEMEKEIFDPVQAGTLRLVPARHDEVLVSLLASGACENIRSSNFVLGESGVTWLPYVFDRLDTDITTAPAAWVQDEAQRLFRRQATSPTSKTSTSSRSCR